MIAQLKMSNLEADNKMTEEGIEAVTKVKIDRDLDLPWLPRFQL